MLPLVIDVLLSPPLRSGLPAPLRHGQSGILDEVLLFGAPLLVTLLILVISSKRARSQKERFRVRAKEGADSETAVEMARDQPIQDNQLEENESS